MANKRIEMINVKHLLRLKLKGCSNRSIGEQLGISRNTINEYVQFFNQQKLSYEALLGLPDGELYALFPKKTNKSSSRYEALSNQFSYYERELKRPGATYLNLWAEYRQTHPGGYGYGQFKNHIQDWIGCQKVSMRVEHKFGDKLFVDYCGKKLELTDRGTGIKTEVEVFVGILGGSQYIYCEASESQQLDDFLCSMSNTLEYLGGTPQAIVPDNLKSAVTLASKYEPHINRNFAAFGLHYRTTILPTRSAKPKDKPLVEAAVKLVYQQIFFPLRNMIFFTLKDLNQAIAEQLEKLNNKPFSNRPYSRRELFEQEEKTKLEHLPRQRFERKIYRRYKVNKDFHVWVGLDKHYYSVPYKYVGKHIQVHISSGTIEVYYNYQRIALHQRSSKVGGFTTIAEHMPSNIRFVKNWSMDYFTDKALKIGPHTHAYFCKVFENKTHPEQAYKACMGMLNLAQQYPNERMEKACQRAQFFGAYSYKTLENILEKGIDQVQIQGQAQSDPPIIINESHPNIRGGDYFK